MSPDTVPATNETLKISKSKIRSYILNSNPSSTVVFYIKVRLTAEAKDLEGVRSWCVLKEMDQDQSGFKFLNKN